MTIKEARLLEQAFELANKKSDGHFTIMRFTTNWRVSLSTPNDREDIGKMYAGSTLEESLERILAAHKTVDNS